MKLLSTLTLAALLTTGAAFAADSKPTATPATSATPAAAPAKHHSAAHCKKEAEAKKLTGDEAKAFMKSCEAGKKAS